MCQCLTAVWAPAGTSKPGQLGENITTGNLDLLILPCGTQLRIGPEAVVQVTGCATRALRSMLSSHVCSTPFGNGEVVHKAGIMGIVLKGGRVMPGDGIVVRPPAEPHHALEGV